MGSAGILEQNWKSEQVRPGHSPQWRCRVSSVTKKETERGSRGKVAGCGVVGGSRGAAQTVCEEGRAFQKQTQSLRLGVRIHCFVRIAFRTTVIVLHSLPTR